MEYCDDYTSYGDVPMADAFYAYAPVMPHGYDDSMAVGDVALPPFAMSALAGYAGDAESALTSFNATAAAQFGSLTAGVTPMFVDPAEVDAQLATPGEVELANVSSDVLLDKMIQVAATKRNYVLPHTVKINGDTFSFRSRNHGLQYEMAKKPPLSEPRAAAGRTAEPRRRERLAGEPRLRTQRMALQKYLDVLLSTDAVQTAGVMYHQWLALLERGLPVVKLVLAREGEFVDSPWFFTATLAADETKLRHDPYNTRVSAVGMSRPTGFRVEFTIAPSRPKSGAFA